MIKFVFCDKMAKYSASYIRNCFKDAVGWIFLVLVGLSLVLLVLMEIISPNLLANMHDNSLGDLIADSRCICVCPHNLNTTAKYNTTIFVRQVDDAGDCICENTVPIEEQDLEMKLLCLRCECQYESRNTALIALIVYGMMVTVFCLMPPCGLVVCIYPFVARRQQLAATSRGHSYSPLHNPPSPYTRGRSDSRRSLSPGTSVVIQRLEERT